MNRIAARAHPDWRFVFLGRVEDPRIHTLESLSNVELRGEVPYAELAVHLKEFDVGLIPFVCNRLTDAVNPLKLLEYFALGLPVLSARLPELESMPGPLRLARTREDCASGLQALLTETPDREEAVKVASMNTWDHRVECLSDFAESLSAERAGSVRFEVAQAF